MSLPLIVKSKLFWKYNGQLDCCWYLGWGDGTSVAKQNAYIDDMDRFGIDTITLNLLNEGISSPFNGEFMNSSLNQQKVDLMFGFIDRLKARGKIVVIVFFDCPRDDKGKYPFWKFTDRIGPFLEIATKAFAPKVDGFIIGIETNRGPTITTGRGLSIEEIDMGIGLVQQFAVRTVNGVEHKLPVGTHEQSYRIPSKADFIGYETKNHPVNQGDSTSVAGMVADVQGLVNVAGGKPVWVIESNSSEGSTAKAQNNAMANIPGVVGIGGPL
jgi:hypothetical protein